MGAFDSLMSPSGLAVIGVTLALTYIAYWFLIAPYRVLSRHGIRGPTPLPIVGNFHNFYKIGFMKFAEEQRKKFGPVFGFYTGCNPKLVITDVELAKEIMVKEFDQFTDRGYLGGATLTYKAMEVPHGLIIGTGDVWKLGRHTLTPSFSAMKMKLMVPLIQKSLNVLIEKFGKCAELGKSVEISRLYRLFTMETLLATAFGRCVEIQRGEADQLTRAAQYIFSQNQEGKSIPLQIVLSNFPWVEPLILRYIRNSKLGHSGKFLYKTTVGLITDRIQSQQPPKLKDLLQLMIDSMDDENGDDKIPGKLTKELIAVNALDFLLAGHETTTTLLNYTSYLLALNSDVQRKLQAEIDEYFEEDPDASLYEAAQKLKYLDMVIQETLRLYTPVPRTQRRCYKTVTIRNVTIPEGTDMMIPLQLIHRMPEFWPDPHKFDPERFTAEAKASRPQMAHMPFGWGPRNCIGLRFALLESKIVLMETLKKFSFARGPETVDNIMPSQGITISSGIKVLIKIIPRV